MRRRGCPLKRWLRRLREAATKEHFPAASLLLEALAYEVISVIWSGAALATIAWLVLGGRVEDLYRIAAGGRSDLSHEVATVVIGAEALAVWNPADPDPAGTPRALLATLVRFADEAGARTIVLDVLLDRPTHGADMTAGGDEALQAAVERHGRVVGAVRYVAGPAFGIPFVNGPPPVLARSLLPAFANLVGERPLLLQGAEAPLIARAAWLSRSVNYVSTDSAWPSGVLTGETLENVRMPSLALAAAWLQRAPATTPRGALQAALASCATPCTALGELNLHGVPVDAAPAVAFRGPADGDGIPTVDAATALRVAALQTVAGIPTALSDTLRGKVVVIGRATGEEDLYLTPFSVPALSEADTRGYRIQAQIIDALLTGRRERLIGGGWPAWVGALVVAGAVWRLEPRASRAVHALLVAVGMAGALAIGTATFWLTDGLALSLGPALGAAALTATATQLRGWVRDQLAS